ncbi:MAG: diacylglycerol kinase family protein [Ginsengibacter sp.]
MENPSCLKILFVINPVSGTKKKVDWEPLIRNYFKNLSHTIEFYLLTGKDDTGSLDYWIEKLQITRIIAVGGDGTVTLIAKQLLGKDLIMGILPAGSANGMAKELQIPEMPGEALDVIINGIVKSCDAIKINDNDICLHLSDFGLNARLIKYFDESTLRGMWGYARMVLKVLWYKKLLNAHIVADNLDLETKAFMIVIANASKYGTGAVINPEGNIGDGLFEIVIVRKLSLLQLFKMFRGNKHLNPKKVEVFQTKTASITTSRKTHFQVDGEYLGKINKVSAKILPAQLKLLVKQNENTNTSDRTTGK